MTRFVRFLLACAVSSLAIAGPVEAQTVPGSVGTAAPAGTYQLLTGNGSVLVDALITTNAAGHATGISGLVNGSDPITSLSSYAGADNNLYITGAWVTFGGLSFSTTSLGDFNFYNSGSGYYGLLSSRRDINGYADGVIATAQLAPVPEPATWAVMLIGFVGIGMTMRRRRRTEAFMQIA